ncbi:MAG: nucleotidyltransferase family protein [Rhodospirillales bacterium]
MSPTIETAMVLAAGFGKRMRPLTDSLPKPLVEVAGRSLLDRALDRLEEVDVTRVVVNGHYLANQLYQHLQARARPTIRISDETDAILETGGGVARALPLLEADVFFVINGDSLWLNGAQDALQRLKNAWNPATMDALLLVHPTHRAHGYDGKGDFELAPDGRLIRRAEWDVSPYAFMGVQILHRRLFEGAPEGAFSLNLLYNKAEKAGRLKGLLHDGEWFHVGTPKDRDATEAYLLGEEASEEEDA